MASVLRNPMIMTGFALILTVTARWVVDMIGTASELLDPASNDPQAPARLTTTLGFCFFLASLIICDAMIVYRLWSVWNKSVLVAIFPFVSLFGMLASGIAFIHQLTKSPRGASFSSGDLGRLIVIDSVFNLVTNVYSTGLIGYRIYSVNSRTGMQGGNLNNVITIMVESSALLSAWIVFEMVVHGTKSSLEILVISTLETVSGISFMLINVRVALGWSQIDRTLSGSRDRGSESNNRAYPATAPPLTRVRMETHVDTHVDIPRKGDTDHVYELDGMSKNRLSTHI